MSLDEFKEKHNGGVDAEKEAFDELCAMVENLQAEREERRQAAFTRFENNKARNAKLRERKDSLKAKYLALLELYNEFAEEPKDKSDSSSDDDDADDDDDTCTLM